MIATRSEIKTLLQIADTTYDSLIDTLLPICQGHIFAYTGSHFGVIPINAAGLKMSGLTALTFAAADDSITDTAAGLPVFAVGSDIAIRGSQLNDGQYTVKTSTASVLTVNESLIDEGYISGQDVTIYLCKFPSSLKLIMANMIGFHIQNRDAGVVSESISGAISTTYSDDGGDYPDGVKKALNKFRVVRL
jgi:hypothetical protein